MKEYAFTKWLVPALQADGTERDMVYNEQMGIFTVRGENQFQKGSIDTQHTVSLLVLKGEISIQTNDKRTVIPAPSYIEFIEPHQWSDLKTNRDFEGCLLITRREIFLQAAECIRSKVAAYVYRHVLEPFIPLEKQDLLRIQSHIDMCATPFSKKKIISCLKCWKINPAKRKAMAVKNEKRFLKQKRNALKNPGYSRHPVKTQASFKRLLKAV